tara:strand:- start:39063 stop:40190 length:1128 start_codon:yes stop_codon:yes gene_type:complete
MGLIIAKQEEIDSYFASEAINQSTLKNLAGGLGGFMASVAKRKKEKEENKPTPEHFLIGSAVDTILTGETEEFEKQYYISRLDKKPSEVEVSIVKAVYDELVDNLVDLESVDFDDCQDMILIAANEEKWQTRWKDDTRILKLVSAGNAYFQDLVASFGKEILSTKQNETIQNIVNSLRHHSRTAKYFNRQLQEEIEDMDFYYQLPILFKYEGIECKALMDLCAVRRDADGKVIAITPIDLKTMSGGTLQFSDQIRKRRYDIQAAWYTLALASHFDFPIEDIDPFLFVVESSTSIGSPLVFEITPETLAHGQTGAPECLFTDSTTGRSIHYKPTFGYEQLLEDYKYYVENEFREDRILEDNPGPIKLDWLRGVISN